MPRLFLGLELPVPVRDCLLSWSAEISGARWQRLDQLHLTLCFLGQLEPEQVPAVFQAMAYLPGVPFNLQPVGVGCFGDPLRPRTLWADVRPVDPVRDLHQQVTEQVQAAGLSVQERHFTPHITLARFGRRNGGSAEAFLKNHQSVTAPGFLVDQVSLFLSQTSEAGSRYQVLARFPLTAGPTPL